MHHPLTLDMLMGFCGQTHHVNMLKLQYLRIFCDQMQISSTYLPFSLQVTI